MKAELILKNAQLFTFDEMYRGADALAVSDGKILKIGSEADMLPLTGPETRVLDCGGKTVLPGLCDAHCHGSMSANMFGACQLFDIDTAEGETGDDEVDKIVAALQAFDAAHPADIIRGIGWNQAHFDGSGVHPKRTLSRHDLDRVSRDRPVVLESYCQHALWTNTKALELAGLTADTPQPPFGYYETEADGYPSGVFHDAEAIAYIKEGMPGYDYTVEEYKKTIGQYLSTCVTNYGVTLIQEAKLSENAIRAYAELAAEDALPARIRAVYCVDHPCEAREEQTVLARRNEHTENELFQINTVKYFLEGMFVMLEPYSHEYCQAQGKPDDYCGELFFDDETLTRSFETMMQAGYQIHIHAMGDAAVHQAVHCLKNAQDHTGTKNRNVIAHVMCIPEEDKQVMGQAELVASIQPRWGVVDVDVHDGYMYLLGKERAERVFPDRSLSDAGCVVAYGTDFPVTPPPNPFHGICCALRREDIPCGRDYERVKGLQLGPDGDPSADVVSLTDAVRRSSLNGAYQMFLEQVTGELAEGRSAELVLLDCDLTAIPETEIYAVTVERTFFRGREVYTKADAKGAL